MVNSFVMTSKNAVGYRVESYRRWQERSISKELAGMRPRNRDEHDHLSGVKSPRQWRFLVPWPISG